MIIAEFVLDEQFRHIPIAGLNVHYMRELGFGVMRFNDIRAITGAPRDTLATWLRQRECVTSFTEELPWLTGTDLELVMGRGVRNWIGWT